MELRHLRYVLAAAETGSIRAAARLLQVEQSSISRRIRDLENEIGAAIFIRKHSGVVPTFAGEEFLRQMRGAMVRIDQATADIGMAGAGESGTVRIGLISSMASGFLPRLIAEFKSRHSGVELHYTEGGLNEQILAVQQHRIDVTFVIGPVEAPHCDVFELWREHVCAAMAVSDTLAKKDSVAWSDLRTQRFIVTDTARGTEVHDFIIQHLASPGIRPRIDRHAVHRDMLLQIVAGGSALTLINEAAGGMIATGVVLRPISGEDITYCAVRSPTNDNPAARKMVSLAREFAKPYLKRVE